MSTIKCIVTEKRDFISPVCRDFLDEVGSVLLLLCMIAFGLVTFLIWLRVESLSRPSITSTGVLFTDINLFIASTSRVIRAWIACMSSSLTCSSPIGFTVCPSTIFDTTSSNSVASLNNILLNSVKYKVTKQPYLVKQSAHNSMQINWYVLIQVI